MRTTSPFWYPSKDLVVASGSFSTQGISTDNSDIGIVTYMPHTTTIDKIAAAVSATTTAGDLTAKIQTVTASTFNPSGSLYHANASGVRAMAAPDDNAWFEFTLTAPVVVTGGDLVAFTVGRVTGTFTGTMKTGTIVNDSLSIPLNLARSSGGAWAALGVSRGGLIAVHSTTDGWLYIPSMPTYDSTSTTLPSFSSATSPDEVGGKLVMPFTARLIAIEHYIGSNGSTDAYTIRLYDESDNVLWSKSLTTGTDQPATSGLRIYPMPDRPILKKGRVYRFAIEATNGTITFGYTAASSGYSDATGISGLVLTSRTNAGAWTDTTTQAPMVGFLFDQVGTNIPTHPLVA